MKFSKYLVLWMFVLKKLITTIPHPLFVTPLTCTLTLVAIADASWDGITNEQEQCCHIWKDSSRLALSVGVGIREVKGCGGVEILWDSHAQCISSRSQERCVPPHAPWPRLQPVKWFGHCLPLLSAIKVSFALVIFIVFIFHLWFSWLCCWVFLFS